MCNNRVHMTLIVHQHTHDVSTVLLPCPITSITCPMKVQMGLKITNHVLKFCYGFEEPSPPRCDQHETSPYDCTHPPANSY